MTLVQTHDMRQDRCGLATAVGDQHNWLNPVVCFVARYVHLRSCKIQPRCNGIDAMAMLAKCVGTDAIMMIVWHSNNAIWYQYMVMAFRLDCNVA